jgi:phosphate starvation-inducible protein PhoH and related proteins
MLLEDSFKYPIIKDVYDDFVCPKTENQLLLCNAIQDPKNKIIFISGLAGTGKTFLSIANAIKLIQDKKFTSLVLSRPIVASEDLGFLPGDLESKIYYYMQPLYEYIEDFVANKITRKVKKQARKKPKTENSFDINLPDWVTVAPLAFMRGRTLGPNVILVADEMQNASQQQMITLLSRIGNNSKFIITGDERQVDLKHKKESGLKDAINRLQDIPGIVHIEMQKEDILRNGIIKEILSRYNI